MSVKLRADEAVKSEQQVITLAEFAYSELNKCYNAFGQYDVDELNIGV